MQLEADPGARVVNNTWSGGNTVCTGCGSLFLRDYAPGSSWTKPPFNYTRHLNGTVIENNIMRRLGVDSPATAAQFTEDYNTITDTNRSRSSGVKGAHTTFASVAFANAAAGDFALSPLGGGIDSADSNVAPGIDLFGHSPWDDPAVANTGAGPVTYADRGAVELVPPSGAPTGRAHSFRLWLKPALKRRAMRRGRFGIRLRCNVRCVVSLKGHLAPQRRAKANGAKHGHVRKLMLHGKRVVLRRGKARKLYLRVPGKASASFRRLAQHGRLIVVAHAQNRAGRVVTKRLNVRFRF
jgi:hypothetical protein